MNLDAAPLEERNRPAESDATASVPALGRLASQRWLTFAGLLPLLVLVYAQWSVPPLASGGDFAQYLLHAMALADGRPYGDTGYIYSPYAWGIGPALQPPVWPLMLTPVVRLFGPMGDAPRVLAAAAGVAFLALAWSRFAGREGRVAATLAVVFTGAALQQAYALSAPLSDLPFAALVWLCISVGDREGEWGWWRIVLLGLLAVLAAGTRLIGLALLPAILLSGVMRTPRERRRTLIVGASAIALAAVAIVALGDHVPFVHAITTGGLPTMRESVNRVWSYRFGVLDLALYPLAWDRWNDAYHAVSTLLLITGFVALARRYSRTFLGAAVLCYVAALVLSPVADVRYSWPLWPVGALALAKGLELVLRRVPMGAATPHRLTAALLFPVAMLAMWRLGTRPMPPSFTTDKATQELFGWFERAPNRDSIRVVFGSPRIFALYTGIPAMGTFKRVTRKETMAELDRLGITHVIGGLGPLGPGTELVENSARAAANPWTMVFENDAYRVLERPHARTAP